MKSLTQVATTIVFVYKATTDNVIKPDFFNTGVITIPDKSLEIQKHIG